VVDNRVSPTFSALAGMSRGDSKSSRRNTIPVSGAAGRRVKKTFSPVWSPTPVARITFFKVRCFIIDVDSPSRYPVNFQLLKRSISQFFNDAALLHLPD
jgi:hypothetical protein